MSFTLRNDVTKIVLLQTQKFRNQGDSLKHHCNLKIDHNLVSLSTVVKPFKVSAHISRHTEQSGHFQFIYVNKRLIKNKNLYKLVSEHLSKSFYLRNIGKEDNTMNEKLKEKPVFIINIQCPHGEYDITSDPRKCQVEFQKWDVVTKCLEEMMKQLVSAEGELHITKTSASEEPDKQGPKEKQDSDEDPIPIASKVLCGAPAKRIIESEVLNPRNNGTDLAKTLLTNSNNNCKKYPICNEDSNKRLKEKENYGNKKNGLASTEAVITVISQQNDLEKENSFFSSSSNSKSKQKINSDGSQQSDIENPFPFKVPTQKLYAKKRKFFSEHITTENESDITPVKQKSLWNNAVSKYERKNNISILPIASEEFFSNAIKNTLMTTNILFDSSKICSNSTPTQAFQINMYRSVKEDRKNNFLKYIEQNSVKYMDIKNDKSFYLNCYEGTESSISKSNKGSKTISKQRLSNRPLKAVTDQYQRKLFKKVEFEQSNISFIQRKKHFKHNWKLFSPIFKHLTTQSSNKHNRSIFQNVSRNNIKFQRNFVSNRENCPQTPSKLGTYTIEREKPSCPTEEENKLGYLSVPVSQQKRYKRLSIERQKYRTKGKSKDETFKDGKTLIETIQHVPQGKINGVILNTQSNHKEESFFHCNKLTRVNKNMMNYSGRFKNDSSAAITTFGDCVNENIKENYDKTPFKPHSLLNRDTNQRNLETPNTKFYNHWDSPVITPKVMSDNLIKQATLNHDNCFQELGKQVFLSNNETNIEAQDIVVEKLRHESCQDIPDSYENDVLNRNSNLFYNKTFNFKQENVSSIPFNLNFEDFSKSKLKSVNYSNLTSSVHDIQAVNDKKLTDQKFAFETTERNKDYKDYSRNLHSETFNLITRNFPDKKFQSTSVQTDSFELLKTSMQTNNLHQVNQIENKDNSTNVQITPTKSQNINCVEVSNIKSLTNTISPLKEVVDSNLLLNDVQKTKSPLSNNSTTDFPLKEMQINDSSLKELEIINSSLANMQISNSTLKNEQINDSQLHDVLMSHSPLLEVQVTNNFMLYQESPKVNILNNAILEHDEYSHNNNLNEINQTNNIHVHPQRWNIEMTPKGRTIYIHPLTGMSSFQAPQPDNDIPYILNNRHWFMTKGSSPLLQMNCSTDNLKQLTDSERNAIQNIVESNDTAELDTVKWKNGKTQGKSIHFN